MTGTRDARNRLLDAAWSLLREGGVAAASPAAIAERAGAGKMSLYRHFEGKDELLAEALADHDAPHRALLLGPEGADPKARLLGVFDLAYDRASSPGYRGCPYVRTRLSCTDPDHPTAAVSRAHKSAVTAAFADLLAQAGRPADTAPALLMLLDGASLHAVLYADPTPFRTARKAAEALLT